VNLSTRCYTRKQGSKSNSHSSKRLTDEASIAETFGTGSPGGLNHKNTNMNSKNDFYKTIKNAIRKAVPTLSNDLLNNAVTEVSVALLEKSESVENLFNPDLDEDAQMSAIPLKWTKGKKKG
jgi:hypothetical protein